MRTLSALLLLATAGCAGVEYNAEVDVKPFAERSSDVVEAKFIVKFKIDDKPKVSYNEKEKATR